MTKRLLLSALCATVFALFSYAQDNNDALTTVFSERVFPQILPCVFMPSKNFQKFCAVSTLFFFLSMTYSLSIFYVNRMR